jgi:hypothetical protein
LTFFESAARLALRVATAQLFGTKQEQSFRCISPYVKGQSHPNRQTLSKTHWHALRWRVDVAPTQEDAMAKKAKKAKKARKKK